MSNNLNQTRLVIRQWIDNLFDESNSSSELYFLANVGFSYDAEDVLMLPCPATVGQRFNIGNEDAQVVSKVDNVCVFAKISSSPIASIRDNSDLLTYFAAPVVSLLHLDDPTALSHVCFLEPGTFVDLHDGSITLCSDDEEEEEDIDVCQ